MTVVHLNLDNLSGSSEANVGVLNVVSPCQVSQLYIVTMAKKDISRAKSPCPPRARSTTRNPLEDTPGRSWAKRTARRTLDPTLDLGVAPAKGGAPFTSAQLPTVSTGADRERHSFATAVLGAQTSLADDDENRPSTASTTMLMAFLEDGFNNITDVSVQRLWKNNAGR